MGGNKCDREDRKVSFEEGSKLAQEFNMKYYETSAKTNHNVNETFTYFTKDILSNTETKKPIGGNVNLGEGSDEPKKKRLLLSICDYEMILFLSNVFIYFMMN